jgi:hypothetical protein
VPRARRRRTGHAGAADDEAGRSARARATDQLANEATKQAQVAAQAAHDAQSAAATGDQTKSEAAAEAAAKAATDTHITALAVQETVDALTKIVAKIPFP